MLHQLFQRIFVTNKRRDRVEAKTKRFSRKLHFECLEARRVLDSSNVVFLFDETFSTTAAAIQEEWLGDVVGELDISLSDAGITDRRYGLVGFGNLDTSQEFAYSHAINPGASDNLFGTASQIATAALGISGATIFSETEDGWDAIEHAVAEYNFDPGAAVLLVLIQNGHGHTILNGITESAWTELGMLAAMKSHNITLTTVIEADFEQEAPTEQLFAAGGVVYGVEADPIPDDAIFEQVAYVDMPVTNNGLPSGVFSDEEVGGPHRINGSTAGLLEGFTNTDDDYVRLGWKTGGSAWNFDVIRQGQNAAPGTEAADRLAEFNDFFVGNLTDQVERKLANGDVAFTDNPIVEINMGTQVGDPVVGNFINDTDPILGPSFLPSGSVIETVFGAISPNGNSVASEVPLAVFDNARTVSTLDLNLSIPSSLVPNGSYVVELLFADLGGSQFALADVELEGAQVLKNYSIRFDVAKIGAVNGEQELETSVLQSNTSIAKRFHVEVSDGNGLDVNMKNSGGLPLTILNGLRILEPTKAPRVENVIVKGSGWTSGFEYSFAEIVGLGRQLRPISKTNVNTIEIYFDKPMMISPDGSELTLVQTVKDPILGVTTIPLTAINFAQSPDNTIGIWTFDNLVKNGKYAIHLSTDVTGVDGQALDGEWDNDDNGDFNMNGFFNDDNTPDDFSDDMGKTLISGDGIAGSSDANEDGSIFRFHFAILQGDYDQDGDVDDEDELLLQQLDVLADGDGDGDTVVDIDDITIWEDNFGELRVLRALIDADFNDDEIVDGRDLVLWAQGFTTSGVEGDVDGDGDSDGTDFLLWQQAFGNKSAWYVGNWNVSSGSYSTGSSGYPLLVGLAAPHITNLVISGSISLHDPYSFDTADGSGMQLQTVPVGGADTISLTFSELVNISADSLRVIGLYSANVPQLAEFTYDLMTMTAAWRFESWSLGDQYLISLPDSVTDVEGNLLDGEWTNPASINTVNSLVSTFPSGDGTPGGNFNFVATLLPGDLNLDQVVDINDYNIMYANYLAGMSVGALFADGDFSGDGAVNIIDAYLMWDEYFSQVDLTDVSVLSDIDGNFLVDDGDINTINDNFGMTGATYADGDLNGNGVVDIEDLDLAFEQFGLGLDLVS